MKQQNNYFRDKSADSTPTFFDVNAASNSLNNIQKDNLKHPFAEIQSHSKSRVNISKSTLVSVIDNLNLNKSSTFKDEGSINFRKKIDKLNLKFYVETEKYLNNKNDMDRCQDQLFIILFREISAFNEEVERLNILIQGLKLQMGMPKSDAKEFDQMIGHCNNLRILNKEMEKKLNEKSNEEKRLNSDIESLKAQIKVLKDKLLIEQRKNVNSIDINSSSILTSTGSGGCSKQDISSEKFISLMLNESKDKGFGFKPNLSKGNFHKKNSKTVPSSSGSTSQSSTSTNPIDVCIAISKMNANKRNLSDNQPQAVSLLKNQKELCILDEKVEFDEDKISLISDIKSKEQTYASKKPLVMTLYILYQ